MTAAATIPAPAVEKIQCEECATKGAKPVPHFEQLGHHLKAVHGISTADYLAKYPGKPIMTAKVRAQLANAQQARQNQLKPQVEAKPVEPPKFLKFGVAKLPIRNDLSESDKLRVPAHDDDYEIDDKQLEVLALGIQQGENVLMVGPTGLGKTSLAEELASIVNQPVIKVGMHKDFRASDFIGEKVVEVDATTGQAVVIWRDGVLPQAMEGGWWLIIDEADALPPGIAFALQQVLEERKVRKLVLAADGGRTVHAAPDFRIIGTANTIGKGDDTGLYTGTNVMNEAWLDRWSTTMLMGYLKPELEAKVVANKAKIPLATATKMVEAATLVRGGLEKEECFCTFSTRRLIAWARKTVALGGRHWTAASLTVFNKLSSDDRKYVEGIVQRVLGKGA